MPRLPLVPVVFVLLLASGCGSDDVSVTADPPVPRETVTVTATPSPTATPEAQTGSPTPVPTTTATKAPAPPPTDLSEYDAPGFTTPSGNIGCQFDDYQGPHIRCDRLKMDTVPPGKPADCDFDWGHSVELSPGRRGALACTSDTVMGQPGETDGSRALPYGDSVTYRGLLCTSTRKGLRCSAQGHGFLLSRAAIRVS